MESKQKAVEACKKLRDYNSKFYTIKEYGPGDGDFKGYEAGASEDDYAIAVHNWWSLDDGIHVSYYG